MESLKDQLWAVAKEYARAAAKILDLSVEGWTAEKMGVDTCEFSGDIYLTLQEMQVLVDDIDRWTARFGSREKVAEAVWAWWEHETDITDYVTMPTMQEIADTKADPLTETAPDPCAPERPRINLYTWLSGEAEGTEGTIPAVGSDGAAERTTEGLSPSAPEPTAERTEEPSGNRTEESSADRLSARILRLQRQHAALQPLIRDYGASRSLGNVSDNLWQILRNLAARQAEEDAKFLERMKQSDAYKTLQQTIDDGEY